MNSTSFLLADSAPSIGFKDFHPELENTLINRGGDATGEVLNHWLFTAALPDWMQYLLIFLASVSVLMLVVGGVMLMFVGANEEMQTRGTKTIVSAIGGVIVSVLSYTIIEIVNQIPITEGNPDASRININDTQGVLENLASGTLSTEIIPSIITLILQLVGIGALLLLLYAGGILVMRDSDDEKVSQARKLIIWALVGIVVVVLAYVIMEAVLNFNFERN